MLDFAYDSGCKSGTMAPGCLLFLQVQNFDSFTQPSESKKLLCQLKNLFFNKYIF